MISSRDALTSFLLLWVLLISGAARAQEAPIIPPVVLEAPQPNYPGAARELNVQGRVILSVDVDETGRVTGARVVEGVHPSLDEAALAAAEHLVFQPAIQDGHVVAATIGYAYTFSLGTVATDNPATPATLHGSVENSEGLPVPDAQVVLSAEGQQPLAFTTNARGKFTAAFIPPGEWVVSASREGFVAADYDVHLGPGETLTAEFTLSIEDAMEVIVFATRETWREVSRGKREADPGTVTGVYELTRRDMESTPGSMEDITRAAHALPGVVSDGDLLAGFHVRGGEQSDVVYMLDGVPLENPFHLAGFNSIFNPDMVQKVNFYAGAPPAQVPAATSAVMAVETWDGRPREPGGGIDGAVDLSGGAARLLLLAPLDRDGKVTVAFAARRTYLEAYFALMQAANLIDQAFAAPEFNELSGRVSWRPNPNSQYILTLMRTGDSLSIVDSGDDSVIQIDGSYELKNVLYFNSFAAKWNLGPKTRLSSTVAYTRDRSRQERELAGEASQLTTVDRGFGRVDLVHPVEDHTFSFGVDASYFHIDNQGEVPDSRATPTWAQVGLADLGRPVIQVASVASWAEANWYGQWEFKSPVNLRAGVRGTYAGLSDDWLVSPRAGVSVPLPTATIPKVSWGRYFRIFRDPFVLDPVMGNPDLSPEQADHLILGIDQGIPLPWEDSGILLRVEGYRIWLSQLVSNPDDQAVVDAGTTYENAAKGTNTGIDFMASARTGRWSAQIAYGLLYARRLNTLNEVYPEEVLPPQDQRHTFRISGDWQPLPHWRFTTQFSYHSGRPVSTVRVASADTVAIDCLNCERLGPYYNVDLRVEWRRAYRYYRLTFYLELLNTGNIQSPFLPIYEVEDGVVVESSLNHLPMRPFLGLRMDF